VAGISSCGFKIKMEKIKWIEEYLEEALRLSWNEGHEPALKLLDRLLFEEPGYARLHYVLGMIYFDQADEVMLAETHFRLAIKFDSSYADPYWYLGKLLSEEGRLEDAIEILNKGLQAKKAKKWLLLGEVGKAYELKKKFSKAINHYKKALGHSAELWNCIALEESIKRCKRKSK
jgi:Uncharacterized enzyme of heme biosynthesis